MEMDIEGVAISIDGSELTLLGEGSEWSYEPEGPGKWPDECVGSSKLWADTI